jgi:dipeptidyl aminopeptidase/acylaminoacyl peptidase
MAQTFDPGRMEVAGDAVPLAQGMLGGPRPFSASVNGLLAYRAGGYAEYDGTITQLTWFDRAGAVLATAGEPGQYSSIDLSPDGTRVAVSRVSPQAGRGSGRVKYDIWVHEFARSTNTRITSDPASDWLATWSPDGIHLIYSSERDGPVFNIYRKPASGAGAEELLLKSNEDKSIQDWSRDGKFLLYSITAHGEHSYRPPASHDLWVLPLNRGNPAGQEPKLYLGTEFNESQGRFSPDGHLVAYTSNASGRDEIYVQPFPASVGGKTIVSRGGGVAPRWRRDGKELFYISADSKMMSVEVSTGPVFRAGIPRALFQAPIWGGGTTHHVTRYDVTADGKKFLINSVEGGVPPPSPITVVLNWTALLKK